MTSGRALVLVADIVRSRDLDAGSRRAVQARVHELAEQGSGFRFAGGDEFEWVLPDLPESLDRVLLLRARLAAGEGEVPPVLLRCGLGRGLVTVSSDQGPYAQDGPVFHRAREASERLRTREARPRWSHLAPFRPAGATPRWTAFVDERHDPVRDALLLHMDGLLERWSHAQWQAIACVLGGLRYDEAGRRLGVTAQAVQQRLRAADLERYLEGHDALKAAW